MTQLYEIKPSDCEELINASAADDHIVIFPTHVTRKDGEVVGYCSFGGAPLIHWWLDSKKGTAMDTLRLHKEWEANMKESVVKAYQIACSPDSPYADKMEKLGYKFIGNTNLYIKKL